MNTRLLLLPLPCLLTACLEPNPMLFAADDESSSSSSDGGSQGETDPEEPDEPDAESSESGTDAPEGDESGEAGESGEPEPEPNCDLETHACISNVPLDWNGPLTRIAADHPLGCHGDYATPGTQTYSGVFANAADCTCECGTAGGGECEDEIVVELYPIAPLFGGGILNEGGCDYVTDEVALDDTQLPTYPSHNAMNEYDARVIADAPAVVVPGSCGVVSSMAELSEPMLDDIVQTCEPSAPIGSCDDDTICVPKAEAPFEAGVCIWQEGDQPCPGGTDFTNRHVVDVGVVDTRTCSTCECGSATGESCEDAVVNLWRAPGGAVTVPATGECEYADLGTSDHFSAINYDPGSPSGGWCDHIGGEPEGGVAPERQVTYCCT